MTPEPVEEVRVQASRSARPRRRRRSGGRRGRVAAAVLEGDALEAGEGRLRRDERRAAAGGAAHHHFLAGQCG